MQKGQPSLASRRKESVWAWLWEAQASHYSSIVVETFQIKRKTQWINEAREWNILNGYPTLTVGALPRLGEGSPPDDVMSL